MTYRAAPSAAAKGGISAPHADVYERITDTIITAIEVGAGKWRMPWHAKAGMGTDMPVSVAGRSYRGLNVVALWGASIAKGYDSNVWGTYKAWSEAGAQVKKGEKSTLAVYWNKIRNKKFPAPGEREFIMFAKGFFLFNAEQVDNYTPKQITVASIGERIATAEQFFASIPAEVRHGGGQAYCSRLTGHIQMPVFESFESPEDYYSTRGHETGHWSGHESRLNREFGKRFGDNAYAAEELVAELTAAFLCAHLKISNEPRPDHAQYLSHWLEMLGSDKKAIFTAASKAQAAADYLIALSTAGEAGSGKTTDTADEGEEEGEEELLLAA